jgi:hypothetical protein
VTVADLLASARLVAVICAVVEAGRSGGAVNTPAALIVPVVALPPAMPLTLQVTLASLALLTAATKACVAPSTTDALPGVMVTLMEGGEGCGEGSAAELAPVPAQPSMHALAARRAVRKTKTGVAAWFCDGHAIPKSFLLMLERSRIPAEMQAKGQAKEKRRT